MLDCTDAQLPGAWSPCHCLALGFLSNHHSNTMLGATPACPNCAATQPPGFGQGEANFSHNLTFGHADVDRYLFIFYINRSFYLW